MSKKYDIAVVGGGMTGCATVHHLTQRGITNIAWIVPQQISTSGAAAGILSGEPWDNFTRISHAHGSRFAGYLWQIMRDGLSELTGQLEQWGVSFARGRRVRLILSRHELAECESAVHQLTSAGFSAELFDRAGGRHFPGLGAEVLAVQDSGTVAALVDPGAVLTAFHQRTKIPAINGKVERIASKGTSVFCHLADGGQLEASFVVLACHVEIPGFLPALREALVPYNDQWSTYSCPLGWPAGSLVPGDVFSATHGHIWGGIHPQGNVHCGGARYLRPLAGIGQHKSEWLDDIDQHLARKLGGMFSGEFKPVGGQRAALTDCWPCDELPVIGPMFGESQILLATGYMGNGLVWGYWAGRVVAELIASGQCADLDRRLSPGRFRSLEK